MDIPSDARVPQSTRRRGEGVRMQQESGITSSYYNSNDNYELEIMNITSRVATHDDINAMAAATPSKAGASSKMSNHHRASTASPHDIEEIMMISGARVGNDRFMAADTCSSKGAPPKMSSKEGFVVKADKSQKPKNMAKGRDEYQIMMMNPLVDNYGATMMQMKGRERNQKVRNIKSGERQGKAVVAIKAVSSRAKGAAMGAYKDINRMQYYNREVGAVTGEAEAEEEAVLLEGDVVERVSVRGGIITTSENKRTVGGGRGEGGMVVVLAAPFAGLKAGLQRELRRLMQAALAANERVVEVEVGVRRLRRPLSVKALMVAQPAQAQLKKWTLNMLQVQVALRAPHDPSHLVSFMDSTEEACTALQEMRSIRVASQITMKDGYVPYPWEAKMQQLFPQPRVSLVFSILFVPYSPWDCSFSSYNSVDDTVGRAMTWLAASQASGIPISFLNLQTEPLLTKVSGHDASRCTVSASLREDLSSVINTGIYGFEDYHGIDIGVVRAVRLWYVPIIAEMPILLKPEDDNSPLGIGIYTTDEGFCCVSSVEDDTVADKAGLKVIHKRAKRFNQLIVITRVEEEKITPSMISSSGCVRCYDTVSISQKFGMYRRVGHALRIHILALDEATLDAHVSNRSEVINNISSFECHQSPLVDDEGRKLQREPSLDRSGSFSFRIV